MSTSRVRKDLNPEWVRQGATVRQMREMRGLSVDDLAKRLRLSGGRSVSRPYMSNIEAGRKRLTPTLAAQIAEVLVVAQISILRPDEYDAETAA